MEAVRSVRASVQSFTYILLLIQDLRDIFFTNIYNKIENKMKLN